MNKRRLILIGKWLLTLWAAWAVGCIVFNGKVGEGIAKGVFNNCMGHEEIIQLAKGSETRLADFCRCSTGYVVGRATPFDTFLTGASLFLIQPGYSGAVAVEAGRVCRGHLGL